MNVLISNGLEAWLSGDSDPSVQWRYRKEVLGHSADDGAMKALRAQIGQRGWVATLLALQRPEGQWETPGTQFRDLYHPKYTSTHWRLLIAAELGASCDDVRIARAAELLLDRYAQHGTLGGAESEVCITGNAVRMMHLLGCGDDPRVVRGMDWLLSTQKPDGGWHCFPSDVGTLDGWEAMAAFSVVQNRSPQMQQAVERGAEFYLQRGLLDEGTPAYAPWQRLHYPNHYYYDVLVGLDMLTRLGFGHDPRMKPALDLLESKRSSDGKWAVEAVHPDISPVLDYPLGMPVFPMCLELPGWPSPWLTVTALAVLKRAGRL